MPAYTQPLDIANRALQHCRRQRIFTLDDKSPQAAEILSCYDKLRESELQRNLWKFATRRVILRPIGIDTVLWLPPTWGSGAVPAAGSVWAYTPTSGPETGSLRYWQYTTAEASSTVSPDQDTNCQQYLGPLAIDLYNTGTSGLGNATLSNPSQVYQAGEIALVPSVWNTGATYAVNDVVARVNGSVWSWYVSLVGSNSANDPLTSPTDWALWTSQGRSKNSYGETAAHSPIPLNYPTKIVSSIIYPPAVYLSLYNNNADNPATGSTNWLNLNVITLTQLSVIWPIGTGPSYDQTTSNVFRIPYGFLKRAPTDPKGGMFGYLGANSGSMPEDWVFEGPYLITRDFGPLILRFVGDVFDVRLMDSMFCEGLAVRIASEVAPQLANQDVLGIILKVATAYYKRIMTEARVANAIEIGPITPVENRYVLVRQ